MNTTQIDMTDAPPLTCIGQRRPTRFDRSVANILAAAKAAAERGDYLAIVRTTSGSHMTDLWAAAMTAHYGPCGIHADWTGPDGRPSAEALERIPSVGEDMRDAERRVARLISYYERFGA